MNRFMSQTLNQVHKIILESLQCVQTKATISIFYVDVAIKSYALMDSSIVLSHYNKVNISVSTLPTLPVLKRSQITPKVSPTLSTLDRF